MHPKSFLSNFWGALQKEFSLFFYIQNHVQNMKTKYDIDFSKKSC